MSDYVRAYVQTSVLRAANMARLGQLSNWCELWPANCSASSARACSELANFWPQFAAVAHAAILLCSAFRPQRRLEVRRANFLQTAWRANLRTRTTQRTNNSDCSCSSPDLQVVNGVAGKQSLRFFLSLLSLLSFIHSFSASLEASKAT